MRVSYTNRLSDSLLCSGFAYSREERESALPDWSKAVLAAQGVRRGGSAALDLCYVAAGRLDGYWERGIQVWDIAAGTLIVQEAGGVASLYDGAPPDPWSNEVVASNGRIQEELLSLLARA